MAALSVRLVAGDPPEALAGLASGPAGCFFHTPAWIAAVIATEPRLRFGMIAVEGADGALRAACPLLVASRLGIRRAYSGAWGTYGGIVARDAAAADAARAALERFAGSARVALVRVHDFSGSLAGGGAWIETEEVCQVLDLPEDPDVLFRDAFTMQNRNKIRKAERQGVVVRRASDQAGLERYAALYAESVERWDVARRLPASFFVRLAGVAGVDVWLAERGGETIAGLLNFTWGGQIMNWGNVSRREAWSASPNNLLHWRALQSACADRTGPRLYNFGGSTGLPGVETFKAAFGARPLRYFRRERTAAWARWLLRRGG
jgi:CelD/BcsL family acetyltransferase involved in cellulose biosynthesis